MSKLSGDLIARIVRIYDFVRTPAGEVYGVPREHIDGPRHIVATPAQMAAEAARGVYLDTGEIPSQADATAALSLVDTAAATAPVRDVSLRMAHDPASEANPLFGSATYLDLGTPSGEYVEIWEDDWTVRPATVVPPVLFARTDAIAPLPTPERGDATRADLARILGLSTADPRFRIAWGWLVAQAFPDYARPFLYLVGSQGSGKTTRGLLLANMLEPQAALGGVLKKTERDNNPVAKASFLLTADNMTKLTEDVSNWLCSLVTGLLVRERKLYTNAETVSYVIKRSGIFTGKHLPSGLQDDALERLVTLEFERVPVESIRSDASLLAELRELHPALLGALLDDMAAVMRRLPSTPDSAAKGYRFIDFARVFAALDDLEGIRRDGYVDALVTEATTALAERVADEPDLVAILRVVADARGEWEGTASDLHAAMLRYRPRIGDHIDRDVWWPATARHLGTRLRNQQHALSLVGLSIEFRRMGKSRERRLYLSMSDADRARWVGTVADLEDNRTGRNPFGGNLS